MKLDKEIKENGFAIVSSVIPMDAVDHLLQVLAPLKLGAHRGGVRNLLRISPEVQELARSSSIYVLIEPIVGRDAFPVRSILFDKTPDANWKVAWHQDLTIAVRERRSVQGFGPWSEKEGVVHVQPPVAVLEEMLTVRVHLDDCGLENGPVRVIPGSHRSGRLNPESIEDWCRKQPAEACVVPRGGVLVMRPLLLHASLQAVSPAHRRVIHLEYAASTLPGGLEWHEA
jgi:ectoine hydroxylase-related dioxygenase (phytanoyl-CoA dioxygenase family)